MADFWDNAATALGNFFSGDSSFWNSSKDAFDWSDLVGPAFNAATQVGGQIYAGRAQDEANKAPLKEKALDNYYATQM